MTEQTASAPTAADAPSASSTADLAAVAAQAQALAGKLPGGLTRVSVAANGVEVALEWAAVPAPDILGAGVAVLPAPDAASDDAVAENRVPVTAPLVGTFYRSSSPDKPPFVEIGDQVAVGDVVGVLEAMKLFTDVVSPVAGTVVELTADNGQSVEFEQQVLLIEVPA